MTPEELTRTLGLLKQAQGKPGLIRKIWGAATGASEAAAKELERRGHGLAGGAVRYTPHAGAVLGGKEVLESGPVQRMKRKYQIWKYRRAQRRAQRGYR